MPLLFSYGSLQRADVQLATFGRRLDGQRDELPRFEPSSVRIGDPEVAARLGSTHHANVKFNGDAASRVPGMVFEITDVELARADEYEAASRYERVAVVLASGRQAWVYAMTAETITIARAELTADVSRALIAALNAELSGLYAEPGANHFHLDPLEVTAGRGAFLVVHRDGTPVGCGAVRRLDAETAELKRMYVAPGVRGTGLGRRLVLALEAEARALGVRRLVLETGIRQTAALALYRATGFQPIPLYGEYCLSPSTSICLGKDLEPRP